MQNDRLESLLKIAKEHEKRYEWLQAVEYYKKASDFTIEKNVTKTADIQEKIGFSFFRAAFQSNTNIEFEKRMKLAIQAYQNEQKILETSQEKNKHVRIMQAEASVDYTKSWLAKNHNKIKKLLDLWWTLENQALEAYEIIGDIHSVGLISTDLIEFSFYNLYWYSNFEEEVKLEKKIMSLTEKAISSLSKTNQLFELARAYCFASLWLSGYMYQAPEFRDKRPQILQKGLDYSKKALEIALKTDDAWLIGYAYTSAWVAIVYKNFDHYTGIKQGEKIQKYGNITKDKLLSSYGLRHTGYSLNVLAEFTEDPDKQKEDFKKARSLAHECVRISKIINHIPNVYFGYSIEISSVNWIARIETDSAKKKTILQKAIKRTQEGFEDTRDLKRVSVELNGSLSGSLSLLSGTISDIEEKKELLLEAQSSQEKNIIHIEKFIPHLYTQQSISHHNLGLVQIELAKIETDKLKKVEFLEKAVNSIKKSNKFMKKDLQFHSKTTIINQIIGKHTDLLGRSQQQIYFLTGNEKNLTNAIEAFQEAAKAFMLGEMPSHSAESYWLMAQLKGHRDEHQEASKNYETASKAYELASQGIPQLKDFYIEYSFYMQAWSQIEQARYFHSIAEYNKAKENYKKSAELHESTGQWSYLTPNYFAWANLEEAEDFSRNEQIKRAKHAFQDAQQQFSLAEGSIRQKLEEITTSDEKEMIQKLLKASDLRQEYCKARILLEEAKLLDREGKYLQSSKSYRQASNKIETIIEKIDSEAERKELELLAILCRAWEKMANAEETTSSESYLEAAVLFEQAKERCFTKKASLWTLANSNFCKGLAAGIRYQGSMNLKENAMAKQYIKSSASNYLQAGFKNASEYAKATQRLFDAYTFMNQAENEVDPEKKTKQYQMADNMLQIAAVSFMKAKQPEKTAQVQQILGTVREEKALAVSLTEVMHTPSVTSSTFSFSAPTATTEASVGLEQFEHANIQANLVTSVKQVKIGESFCLSVEFVNAGKEPALLMRVDDFIPSSFVVLKKPEIYRIEDTTLNMKGKQIAPLKLVEVELTLQASKKGEYQLNPRVHYLDKLGQNKSLQLKTLEIKVEKVLLEDRVTTGTEELDSLLLGGIPEEYAVVLSGPPCDEREMIVKNFLEAGIEDGISFYVATEATNSEDLLKNQNFFLFLCNPKPKVEVPDLPNVFKLQGKTDLTNLGIALIKAQRSINQSVTKKRICVEILSDVLVKHRENTTREWISGLITNYEAKGFTMLAVMDPEMHPSDQAKAVLNLFDGEINITQSDDPLDCKKSILVKKLRNQDYIKNPICLR